MYFHSVTLKKEKCKGCTNCLKRCPTEAIRVRGGKAKIIKERCIDCGECIKVCPYHAKKAVVDKFEDIQQFRYKVALPAPTLYSQFSKIDNVKVILAGLKKLGFDEVFEIARGAEIITEAAKRLVAEKQLVKPIINSACPAVVRLIQVRFPNLINHILPILSPMDITARIARKTVMEKTGLKSEDIGIVFISPCAAKMTSVKAPLGMEYSDVDAVISIAEVVGKMAPFIHKLQPEEIEHAAGAIGISWARSGGESDGIGLENCIAVDGIHNVIKVLEEVEDEKLDDVDFVECLSCTGGCVGGPLTVENSFVAKSVINRISQKEAIKEVKELDMDQLIFESQIDYKPIANLGETMEESIRRMEEMKRLYDELPQLDCGSCGAPSCSALTEDVVRGFGKKEDCIFVFKEKLKFLMDEMNELDDRS